MYKIYHDFITTAKTQFKCSHTATQRHYNWMVAFAVLSSHARLLTSCGKLQRSDSHELAAIMRMQMLIGVRITCAA